MQSKKLGKLYKIVRNLGEENMCEVYNSIIDYKNQIISKLHEAFPKQWTMRPVRLAMAKTYTIVNEYFKRY